MAGLDREQIQQYFVDLGMGEPLVDRSLAVMDDVEDLLPDSIEHVFVTEYRDDEGNRHYENLWLLTCGYMSEAQSYLTEKNTFDIVPVHYGIARIEISREHFDFATASDQSRLTIDVSISTHSGSNLSGIFKASSDNCVVLAGILREYLIPLLPTD